MREPTPDTLTHRLDRVTPFQSVAVSTRGRVPPVPARPRRHSASVSCVRRGPRVRAPVIPGCGMSPVCILLALVLSLGLALPPGSAQAGPASGRSQTGGGQPGAAPGAATKGTPAPPGKSAVTSGGPLRSGQPCDVKGVSGFRSIRGFGSAGFSDPTYLIVDASPLEAQVFLDSRLLGTGGDLVARAFPLAPGRHAIEIVAPGFRPYIAQFAVAPGSFPVRFRVALHFE